MVRKNKSEITAGSQPIRRIKALEFLPPYSAKYNWVMIAPLNPTKPFSKPKTTPLLSGKFFTHVTSAPVFANACEFAPAFVNIP